MEDVSVDEPIGNQDAEERDVRDGERAECGRPERSRSEGAVDRGSIPPRFAAGRPRRPRVAPSRIPLGMSGRVALPADAPGPCAGQREEPEGRLPRVEEAHQEMQQDPDLAPGY